MSFRDALAAQFVYLPRGLVADGYVARLMRKCEGPAVALLPVAALLVRGYAEKGAVCQLQRLARLAGISTADAAIARRVLEREGLLRRVAGPRRGVWRIRAGDKLLASYNEPRFRFPGSLVSDGIWASLGGTDRSVLLALAANARTFIPAETLNLDPDEGEVWDWLSDVEAYDSEAYYAQGAIQRAGALTIGDLTLLTGTVRSEVVTSIERLAFSTRVNLLRVLYRGPTVWFHLPKAHWGVEAMEPW